MTHIEQEATGFVESIIKGETLMKDVYDIIEYRFHDSKQLLEYFAEEICALTVRKLQEKNRQDLL